MATLAAVLRATCGIGGQADSGDQVKLVGRADGLDVEQIKSRVQGDSRVVSLGS